MTAAHMSAPPSRLTRGADWTLRVLLALTYVVAGSMKLAGAAISVQIFDAIGFGDWFRYFTGLLDIGCGVLILLPRTAAWAAALLACTMVAALITHAFVGGDAIPAAVLLLLLTTALWVRRAQLSIR